MSSFPYNTIVKICRGIDMSFTVRLADKIIQIENIHPELKVFCKDYIIEDVIPDYSIVLTDEDIRLEQDATEENAFSPQYLETLATLRKLAEIFPSCKRILFHGASISYHDKAYLFTAPSGTGKSTHIRLWKKYLGNDVKIVNGDKPFISLEQETPIIYGTPWAGKERWQRNCQAPLCGICFVTRGTTNTIRRIKPEECITELLHQVFIPTDPTAVALTLELVDLLVKRVPLYLLSCDISEEAVRCSFEALTGLQYPVL